MTKINIIIFNIIPENKNKDIHVKNENMCNVEGFYLVDEKDI